MKRKVIFTATVVKKHIMEFHLPYLKWFKDHNFDTYVAARNDYEIPSNCCIPYCDHFINIQFERNPLGFSNQEAFSKLKTLFKSEHFDIIHCNTPVAGVLTRLAAKSARNDGTKVIYTAHGFHFFKGSSLLSWLIYYPVEVFCSNFTDALITINSEDYKIACTHMHAKNTYLVHGVGMTFNNRSVTLDDSVLTEIHCKKNDFIICTIAELNPGKNQQVIMEAFLTPILSHYDNLKYILIGDGKEFNNYEKFIQSNNLSNKIKLLGYRSDIYNLLKHSKIFVFPSLREGLPVSLMEAMYCGLPCLICNIRGCRDLIDNMQGGVVCDNSPISFANAINMLIQHPEIQKAYGLYNQQRIKPYLIDNVMKEYENIYLKLFNDSSIN